MMKWVWQIGLAAMSGIIAACTGGEVAGSSFETENSVAVVLAVQQQDGSPAARTRVLVRPSDFLAGANNLALSDSSSVQESPVVETDSSCLTCPVRQNCCTLTSFPDPVSRWTGRAM